MADYMMSLLMLMIAVVSMFHTVQSTSCYECIQGPPGVTNMTQSALSDLPQDAKGVNIGNECPDDQDKWPKCDGKTNCFKSSTTTDEGEIVIRACYGEDAPVQCKTHGNAVMCICNTDNCNTAMPLSTSSSVLMSTVAFITALVKLVIA